MSGILRRTIRQGIGGDGYVRISPWALVVTGIGVMFEPNGSGMFSNRDGVVDYDWADEMNMINDVDAYDPMGADKMGDNTCGGAIAPLGTVTSY